MPESFFVMLFGIKWIGVGSYLKWMLPWLFLVILNASLGFIPDLFFRQKTAMHIEIIYFVIRLIALLLGIYFHNFGLAVHLYCGVSALMMAVKVIWYFRLIKKYESFL
jgi:O-antigen/teichoic acid export membrane protein